MIDRFQQNPFAPITEHLNQVKECVSIVHPMFECVRDGQYDQLKALADKVFKTEHKADIIKNEIRQAIPMRFSLPIFRGDLLSHLKLQDDMADSVEDIAAGLTIKDLAMPPELASDILALVDAAVGVCERLYDVMDQLPALLKADFSPSQMEGIFDLVSKAEHAEWEADKAQFQLVQKLFAMDDTMKATDIFLWSNVFKELGRLANHAEKTADRLRRMMHLES